MDFVINIFLVTDANIICNISNCQSKKNYYITINKKIDVK